MTLKDNLKKQINQVISEQYRLFSVDFNIDYPPADELGDYSTNVAMILARQFKKNPLDIAADLASKFSNHKMWSKVSVAPPGFINFYLDHKWASQYLSVIEKQGRAYGRSRLGRGQTVVVDYSSPNIAKKMHVGHLRSTVIGAAICNLYKFIGYRVIADNHLGDWGTQFGKLIYEYKQVYGNKIKKNITVEELEQLYLDFHKKVKDNPDLEEAARKELKQLQDKDKFNYQLWRLFYQVSLKEFKKIYKLLGVTFDYWYGESFYHPMLAPIVEELLKKGLAQKSQGAVIVNLADQGLPPLMIQKSDGAYLYGTSDLATIKYRRDHFHSVKNIYVVANQQSLHFEQLFKASSLIGYHNKEEMVHIKFGLILGVNGKKMSTREGEVAELESVIKDGFARAEKIIKEKNKKLAGPALKKIAGQIALGAIKYNDLSQNRLSDIIFDWDKMLNFDSGSAPYLQYTYVRIQSIFKKVKKPAVKKANYSVLTQPTEIRLIKSIVRFPEMVELAALEYKPNLVALYLGELAANFHSFYEQVPVLSAENEKYRLARLALLRVTSLVMKNGLGLLGIETPEQM